MTPSEAAVFRRFSRAEIELYNAMFGPGAFPHWIPPAQTEWAETAKPLTRYVEVRDSRPKFDVPGVGVVRGDRRLAEVTNTAQKKRYRAVLTDRQWFKQKRPTRVKRLRASAA